MMTRSFKFSYMDRGNGILYRGKFLSFSCCFGKQGVSGVILVPIW